MFVESKSYRQNITPADEKNNSRKIIEAIELNKISIPRDIILYILSFVDLRTIAGSLNLASKAWKATIEKGLSVNYFFHHYYARRYKAPAPVVRDLDLLRFLCIARSFPGVVTYTKSKDASRSNFR